MERGRVEIPVLFFCEFSNEKSMSTLKFFIAYTNNFIAKIRLHRNYRTFHFAVEQIIVQVIIKLA